MSALPIPSRNLRRQPSARIASPLFLAPACLLLLLPVAAPLLPAARAQNAVPVAPSAEETAERLSRISAIESFMEIEGQLAPTLKRTSEDDWAADYLAQYTEYQRAVTADSLEARERPAIALLLGVKGADAAAALKGRGTRQVTTCMKQIEQLAGALDVGDEYLSKAADVTQHAEKKEWHPAYNSMVFLKYRILRVLQEGDDRDGEAVLSIVGFWLQMERYLTATVQAHYSDDLSKLLREPELIEAMIHSIDKLPEAIRKDTHVAALIKLLPELLEKVNVGVSEPVARTEVKWIHDEIGRFLDAVAG